MHNFCLKCTVTGGTTRLRRFFQFFCVDTATSYVHSRCIKTRLQSNNENPAFESRNFLSSGKAVAWTKSLSWFFVPFQLIQNLHAGSLLHTGMTQKHTVRVSEFRTSVTIMYVPFWTCMHLPLTPPSIASPILLSKICWWSRNSHKRSKPPIDGENLRWFGVWCRKARWIR